MAVHYVNLSLKKLFLRTLVKLDIANVKRKRFFLKFFISINKSHPLDTFTGVHNFSSVFELRLVFIPQVIIYFKRFSIIMSYFC